VFKDDLLARSRPDLAVKDRGGRVWHDRERQGWTDPFRPEVWDYNLAVAVEAARLGFDEIQFDYMRFPDAAGLRYAESSTAGGRVRAIEPSSPRPAAGSRRTTSSWQLTSSATSAGIWTTLGSDRRWRRS